MGLELVGVRPDLLLRACGEPLLLSGRDGRLLLQGSQLLLLLLLVELQLLLVELLLLLVVAQLLVVAVRRRRWRRLVVHARVLAVLSVVVVVIRPRRLVPVQVVGVDAQNGGWHGDVGAHRLEATSRRAVFDRPKFAGFVHVTVLAVHLARRVLGLDLVRAVSVLVTVAVRTVLVLSVHLFQDRNDRVVLSGRCGQSAASAECRQCLRFETRKKSTRKMGAIWVVMCGNAQRG